MSGQEQNQAPENRPNHYENIRIENVREAAIAFGGDAILNITHQHFEAPKPPRPDYINMAPDLKHFVQRPNEYQQLRSSLISPEGETVAISAALRGAGGFGKTTLAQRLCYDDQVQKAFPDGILWVELGERPENLVGKVNDLTDVLTGGRPTVIDLNAAAAELAHALGQKHCLMVIDDLWNAAHATPFLHGGPNCTRLITTRNADTLPIGSQAVNVDAMQGNEALAMLVRELPDWEALAQPLIRLADRLGQWPLLLKLANSTLYRRAGQQGLENALDYVNNALDKRGLIAFDAKNLTDRHQAVAATLGVSLAELDDNQQQRFREFAVFPEDTDIPLVAVATLWGKTGGFDEFDTEELCTNLFDRSLLLRYDGVTLRLHDIIRQYLLDQWGDEIQSRHRQLLDGYNEKADWPNGPNDGYYYQTLAYHLNEAGKTADLRTLLLNFDWLQAKLDTTNINELLVDYQVLSARERPLELVEGTLRLSSHVLARDKKQLAGQLRGRLLGFKDEEIKALCAKADEWRGGVWLSPMRPCLDPPGGPLIQTLSGHSAAVNAVAVTPDGRRVLSASDDKTVKVWDLTTGQEERTLIGHTEKVLAVVVTPDNKRVVSASSDATLRIWNLENGQAEGTLKGHADAVRALAVTPDSKWIISASDDKTLKVWNLENGLEERTLRGHTKEIAALAVTPDGEHIVSASYDRTLKIWRLASGQEKHSLGEHFVGVRAAALTPDGKWILSADFKKLKLWNLHDGKKERTFAEHANSVEAMAVTPDGQRVVTATSLTLNVWNMASDQKEQTFEGHSDSVNALVITPDGNRVISASADRTVKVWDISNLRLAGRMDERLLADHSDNVLSVSVTPNGRRAVSASSDKTLKVWNLEKGELEWTLEGHSSLVRSVAVTPDGKRVISTSFDGTMKVWNLRKGREERTIRQSLGHSDVVQSIAVTPDGKSAVTASNDKTLTMWNLRHGKKVRTIGEHSEFVYTVATSPDGRWIISGSNDKTVKVWNLSSKKEEWLLEGHESWVRAVAVTPDGNWAVSASFDKTLRVWNLETGKSKLILGGHSDIVEAVTITGTSEQDENWAVSGSRDRSLKLWNIDTGRELATYNLDRPPRCLAGALNGGKVVVGDDAGQVFWLTLRTP